MCISPTASHPRQCGSCSPVRSVWFGLLLLGVCVKCGPCSLMRLRVRWVAVWGLGVMCTIIGCCGSCVVAGLSGCSIYLSLSLYVEFCAGFVFVALLLVRFYSWAMGVTVIVPFPSWCESLPVRWVSCTVTSNRHSVRSGVMDSRSFSAVRAWNVPSIVPYQTGKPSMRNSWLFSVNKC